MITEQSLLIEVRNTELKKFITHFSNLTKVENQELKNNQWQSICSIIYKGHSYQFSISTKAVSPNVLLINLDCIDETFIPILTSNPDAILRFLLKFIKGSHISYWIMNSKTNNLKKTYEQLHNQDIEISCVKRLSC